jgi:hypothetical protein
MICGQDELVMEMGTERDGAGWSRNGRWRERRKEGHEIK